MASSRYKIEQTPSKITLSAKIIRNRLKLLLTCRDLVIVLLILANIPNLNFESTFNIILLIFLGLFSCQCIYDLLWQLFGQEHIHVQNGILSHQFALFGLGKGKKFSLVEISQWQPHENYANTKNTKITLRNYLSQRRNTSTISSPLRQPNSKQGAWSFVYHGKTIYIGEFFYSNDYQAINSKLNNLIPKKAKTGTLSEPEHGL
jgi:hypothetical protein